MSSTQDKMDEGGPEIMFENGKPMERVSNILFENDNLVVKEEATGEEANWKSKQVCIF